MIKFEEDEKIVKIIRKHWFNIVLEVLFIFIIGFIPVVAFVLFDDVMLNGLSAKNMHMLFFFYMIFLIVIWALLFIVWINYYLDIWLITNKRIIDVDQKGLFYRDIASLRFDKVQDVKIVINGFINTMLKIGDVHVQTASAEKEFIIRQASNPELVKKIIMDLQNIRDERVQTVRLEE